MTARAPFLGSTINLALGLMFLHTKTDRGVQSGEIRFAPSPQRW